MIVCIQLYDIHMDQNTIKKNTHLLLIFNPLFSFILLSCFYPIYIQTPHTQTDTSPTKMEDTKSKFKRICVFCGSSSGKKPTYQEAAVQLGRELVTYSFLSSTYFSPFYNILMLHRTLASFLFRVKFINFCFLLQLLFKIWYRKR